MMLHKLYIAIATFVWLCPCLQLWGQTPDVVVLSDSTSVSVKGVDAYTTFRQRELLLMNNRAADMANIAVVMGPDDELLGFEYQLLDFLSGKPMRTVKKRDLHRVDYSSELATDYYRLVEEVTPPVYPVRIKITSKRSQKGNILSYPMFVPQTSRNMSVEHAVYQISWPTQKVKMRQKALNMEEVLPQTVGNNSVLTYEINRLSAVPSAPFSGPLEEQVPRVFFAPEQFFYYGTEGNMADWRSFGLWNYQLSDGSHFFSNEMTEQQAQALTGCNTDLEKVRALYNLLARNTRYVSLQLGIGGYRPKQAGEVFRMGYGDCKGLSNYMRAMLLAAGIDCRLVLVSTDEPRLVRDFANFQQMNHMVLEAFLPKQEGVDTLWLECTNQDYPVGYIHRGIAGHDALELSDEGGKLLTIPDYADSLNLDHTDVYIDLHADASADVRIDTRHEYHSYSRFRSLMDVPQQKMREELLSLYNLPNGSADVIKMYDDSPLGGTPRLRTHMEVSCQKYANLTGRRLFVAVNPLREYSLSGLNVGSSEQPVFIKRGHREEVEIHISVPEGMKVEALPAPICLEEEFASFQQKVTNDGSKVIVNLCFDLRAGTYPSEARARIAALKQTIAKAFSSKLVLVK